MLHLRSVVAGGWQQYLGMCPHDWYRLHYWLLANFFGNFSIIILLNNNILRLDSFLARLTENNDSDNLLVLLWIILTFRMEKFNSVMADLMYCQKYLKRIFTVFYSQRLKFQLQLNLISNNLIELYLLFYCNWNNTNHTYFKLLTWRISLF